MAKDDSPKCPNGHPATGEGYCSASGCTYHYDNRHGVGR